MPTKVTLTLPTKNVDGSDITAGDLVDVQVGFGTATGNYTLIADDTAFGSQTSAGVVTIPWASLNENLGFGTWFAASRVKNAEGQTSAWSNEATFTIAAPIPAPPTSFTVA
jgi:hypothetical protein